MDKKYGYSEDNGDFLYNTMRQVVNDGMTQITKTLMEDANETSNSDGENRHSRYNDYSAQLSGLYDNDMQRRGQENIPLRPLMLNDTRDNANHNNQTNDT